jgi:SAM-dependent methyltransferase
MSEPAPAESLPPSYFDAVYAANADPWNFEASPYEAAKYAATLAALPRPQYERAFEAGCSIGVLTAQLAARCTELLAVDVSARALIAARTRCAAFPHVRLERRRMPEEFPAGRFDLIVVSEVGYYLSQPDLQTFCRRIAEALAPGGHALLVHWTPRVHDYPLTGDQVHETFAAETKAELRALRHARGEKYRLDLFEHV